MPLENPYLRSKTIHVIFNGLTLLLTSFIWKWKLYITRERGRNHRGIYKKLFFFSHLAFAMNINLLLSNIIYEKVLALTSPSDPSIPSFLFSWSDSFQLDVLRVWLALKLLCCIFIETCQIDTNCLFRFIVFFCLFFAKLFLVYLSCSIKKMWEEIIAFHFLWEFNLFEWLRSMKWRYSIGLPALVLISIIYIVILIWRTMFRGFVDFQTLVRNILVCRNVRGGFQVWRHDLFLIYFLIMTIRVFKLLMSF